MTSPIRIKICGLRTKADVSAAVAAGASYLGFNFFPKSPRFVEFDEARALAQGVQVGVAKVGLVVNVDNELLDQLTATVPLDMLQLHGAETPERVAEVRDRYGLPVMKVLGISGADDLDRIDPYSAVADQLMLDAKPPKDAVLPGGNGVAFDWTLLAGRKYWTKPWMLAGGLNPDNVAEAIRLTGTRQVDVASGVESAPGAKDPTLMRAFCDAALSAG